MIRNQLTLLCLGLLAFASCSSNPVPVFDARVDPAFEGARSYKHLPLPLKRGTAYKISQGPFGCCTHNLPGHEYSWDFDVPYGTKVAAVEGGKVIQVWEPRLEAGCEEKFSEHAHNIKVLHEDGTVAQYVHIRSRVKVNDQVRLGQTIGTTARNGFICRPQLHFSVFEDRLHLPGSRRARTIPLRFDELPNAGYGYEGYEGTAGVSYQDLP